MNVMNESIIKELNTYIDRCLIEDMSFREMFGESDYLMESAGSRRGRLWLKKHNLDSLDALNELHELELKRLGHISTQHFVNHTTLVNHLVYHYGLELCIERGIDNPICV